MKNFFLNIATGKQNKIADGINPDITNHNKYEWV